MSALKAEIVIEKAMVSANWRNRIPVVPGEKGDRHEDRNQHQRRGDDGAGDLLHGVRRCFDGVRLALVQMTLDVFDNDDGVVDDQTRSERDAEQRQRVDGKTEQFNKSESPDERNWDRDRRDDGGAPIFQKNEDDQDDQEDGRAQGRRLRRGWIR